MRKGICEKKKEKNLMSKERICQNQYRLSSGLVEQHSKNLFPFKWSLRRVSAKIVFVNEVCSIYMLLKVKLFVVFFLLFLGVLLWAWGVWDVRPSSLSGWLIKGGYFLNQNCSKLGGRINCQVSIGCILSQLYSIELSSSELIKK